MSGEVDWADGHIVAHGQLNRGTAIRQLSAGLYQSITDRGYRQVKLDFSNCNVVTEAVILPILPLIARYREQDGVSFELTPPESNELYRLFVNTNWAHFIEPERFDARGQSFGNVPARRFQSQEEMWEISGAVLTFIHRSVALHRDVLAAIEWSLNEIMENVLTHAESPVGGFVQATAFESRVEFVVADGGVGIPKSIGLRDDARALEVAVSEGGTRDSEQNQGNGLFGSYQLAVGSDGQFEIHSLNGLLYFDRSRDATSSSNQRIPYSGTSVRCGIGTRDVDAINRAFAFGGKRHEPIFDFVEKRFESDIGETVYRIADHAKHDLGTRTGGRRVRQQIDNLLTDASRVLIDFEGIDVVTSSFADELFGRLFLQLGPRAFMTRIVLRNVHPRIDGLIDRAIILRTRNGNPPPS